LERVERAILTLRGRRVVLDTDLARLYGVSTKRLNEQVKRNPGRFPPEFVFRLNQAEFRRLRSQNATSNTGRGGRRHPPLAFTEHGAVMAANVLNSARAIEVSVLVVRAFVRLRQLAVTHAELSARLDELEGRYDAQFKAVFDAIRTLMEPPRQRTRRIGFSVESRATRNERRPVQLSPRSRLQLPTFKG
jgi:hypothetical protein